MPYDNCDNCFYFGALPGHSVRFCRFSWMTNEKRPCPAGDNCTVKVVRQIHRKRRKAYDSTNVN